MGRRLPPFAAIRAFEAAARHLSVKDAAEELCVTPSAVSHQIKTLEQFLDTGLFNREGNRLALTRTGQTYLGKLTGLLDALDASTREMRGEARDLRVLCTPGFAARWMVPRLNRLRFGDRIRLRISSGAPDTDFSSNDADVVIHWTDSPVPGVVVEPLMSSHRYPVASPELIRREGIETPADLSRLTLLRDETMDAWEDWFHAAGVTPGPLTGPRFPNCEIITTAAERGQGVALAYDAMIRSTLAGGTVQRLFDTVTMPITIYSVAYPVEQARDPMIREFRDWVFAEVAAENLLAHRHQPAAE